ncbi:MAG: Tim44 domain-containing protein [Desulfovibrio sp.]|jgi:predicted lipid-binding transport protein (Tim44 family)|nr:Tim44 domain-containing protein [Desulfovibrio sp.]MBI4961038.1 Tim44 domain-containing protein [Desulfovibrio sp.]
MRLILALAALLGALPERAALAADAVGTASKAALGALDIIFIGIAGYVLWRVISNIANRKKDDNDNGNTYDVPPEDDGDTQDPRERRSRAAQAAWEYLTGEQAKELHPELEAEKDLPGAFNEREFLRGAKMIYGRVKQSFAARDMADLRQFTSPDMMRQFEQMNSERPEREEVAVLLVDARVLDVKKTEKQTQVEVAYDATVSDDPKTKESRKVSEVWRFVRDETVKDGTWLLESMEKTQ